MKEIAIVEYKDGYRDSCINLLKNAFPGSSDEKTFSWRFDTIEENKPIIVCAVDSGKVISFNSWIKWRFECEGKPFIGYQSGESATDINYRRMGIWGKVINLGEKIAKERGIDFFFGFPAEISLGGFIKAGYQLIGTFNKYLRIINPVLLHPNEVVIQKVKDPYKPTLIQNNKITSVVDDKYIKWRYHQNPNKYEIRSYSDNRNLSTFYLKKNMYYNKRFGISAPEIQLLDFSSTSQNEEFIHKSFRYIDSLFARRAIWISTFFNEGTERGKVLRRFCQVCLKFRGEKLIFKKINPEIDDKLFIKFELWDIMPHVMDSY